MSNTVNIIFLLRTIFFFFPLGSCKHNVKGNRYILIQSVLGKTGLKRYLLPTTATTIHFRFLPHMFIRYREQFTRARNTHQLPVLKTTTVIENQPFTESFDFFRLRFTLLAKNKNITFSRRPSLPRRDFVRRTRGFPRPRASPS